jgi:hypothetical protein
VNNTAMMTLKQIRQRANWYTCPCLMTLQWWIWRIWKRNLYWSDGSLCERLYPSGGGAQVRPWWPDWLVILECCLHNRSWWAWRNWWRDREWRRRRP